MLSGTPIGRRMLAALVGALLVSAPSSSRAEDNAPAADAPISDSPLPILPHGGPRSPPPPEPPKPRERVDRALIEQGLMVTGALIGYLWDPPPTVVPGTPDPVTPWDKLALRGKFAAFDADDFYTNMPGHSSAGISYYAVARANRIGVLPSFLLTVCAAATWESLEFLEPASINDLVITPIGGLSIAEPVLRIGHRVYASDGIPGKVLSSVLDPILDVFDWGLKEPAYGHLTWRFSLGATGGFGSDAAVRPLFSLTADLRDQALPSERSGVGPLDPRGARIAAVAESASDSAFQLRYITTQSGLWTGAWWVDGAELMASLTASITYRRPDWGDIGRRDESYFVEFPGLLLGHETSVGGLVVQSQMRAAPEFGGVYPFGLPPRRSEPLQAQLPSVTQVHGYAYALGVMAAPRIDLSAGPVSLGGWLRWDALWAQLDHDVVDPPAGRAIAMTDHMLELGGRLGYRPLAMVDVGLTLERRLREGTLGGTVFKAGQTRAAVVLDLLF